MLSAFVSGLGGTRKFASVGAGPVERGGLHFGMPVGGREGVLVVFGGTSFAVRVVHNWGGAGVALLGRSLEGGVARPAFGARVGASVPDIGPVREGSFWEVCRGPAATPASAFGMIQSGRASLRPTAACVETGLRTALSAAGIGGERGPRGGGPERMYGLVWGSSSRTTFQGAAIDRPAPEPGGRIHVECVWRASSGGGRGRLGHRARSLRGTGQHLVGSIAPQCSGLSANKCAAVGVVPRRSRTLGPG